MLLGCLFTSAHAGSCILSFNSVCENTEYADIQGGLQCVDFYNMRIWGICKHTYCLLEVRYCSSFLSGF